MGLGRGARQQCVGSKLLVANRAAAAAADPVPAAAWPGAAANEAIPVREHRSPTAARARRMWARRVLAAARGRRVKSGEVGSS